MNRQPSPHNPYQTPNADLDDRHDDFEYDTTPFYKARGRIGRIRFLAYCLLLNLCLMLVMALFGIISAIVYPLMRDVTVSVIVVMYVITTVLSFYALFAPSIRRLNDLNKTGWISLLYLIPLLNIILWFYLVLARGDDGLNDYGSPAEPPSLFMKIIAFVMPLFFVGIFGIMAAIALPAYQNYVERAHAVQTSSSKHDINQETQRTEERMHASDDQKPN